MEDFVQHGDNVSFILSDLMDAKKMSSPDRKSYSVGEYV